MDADTSGVKSTAEGTGPETASADAANRWIFRETSERVSAQTLLEQLRASVHVTLQRAENRELALDALMRAAELECALTDTASSNAASLARLSDALAALLLRPQDKTKNEIAWCLDQIALVTASMLDIPRPEGLAYYALHPLDFAEFAAKLSRCASVAVVGIRTIGALLSTVVAAALRNHECAAERITVRPSGHPYDRSTKFTEEQRRWIESHRRQASRFFVVDEGPGLSGSSFLSVAEALVEAGVAPNQITLLGTRAFDPATLHAHNAASRWSRFQYEAISPLTYEARNLGLRLADWRSQCLSGGQIWPSCWRQMERLKFISHDQQWIYKFEGFGRFGRTVQDRAFVLAQHGFGPECEYANDGLMAYKFLRGKHASGLQISRQMLERIARYCAFRGKRFPAPQSASSTLTDMVRFNFAQEFGQEPDIALAGLNTDTPIVADGRMQPYEWIHTGHSLIKVDGTSHGDDHFFPGPTDIAWDLAGAVVEWELDGAAQEYLIETYRALTRDDVSRRLPLFAFAYATFRAAYCKMAGFASRGTPEETLLARDYAHYRNASYTWLQRAGGAKYARFLPTPA